MPQALPLPPKRHGHPPPERRGPSRESQPCHGTRAPASWACCAEPSLASLALRSASSLPFPDLCAAVSSASTMSRSFCGFAVPQAAVCSGVHSLRVFPGWVKSTPACSIFLTATRSPARTLLRKTTACCGSAISERGELPTHETAAVELASSARGGGKQRGFSPPAARPPLHVYVCMILRCVASTLTVLAHARPQRHMWTCVHKPQARDAARASDQKPHVWPLQSAMRFATGRKSRRKATLSRFCRSPGGSAPRLASKKSTCASSK